MDAISPVKKQQSSTMPGSRWASGLAASLLVVILWSQSTAGDPLSESLRGGAGTPSDATRCKWLDSLRYAKFSATVVKNGVPRGL